MYEYCSIIYSPIIVGGCSDDECPLNDVWIFDFVEQWKEVRPLNSGPAARNYPASAPLHEEVTGDPSKVTNRGFVIFGGTAGATEFWEFRFLENTWSRTVSNGPNLQSANMVFLPKTKPTDPYYSALIFGGFDGYV